MGKKKAPKEIKAILINADGTVCEDISKKQWSPELRQRVAEKMGDIMLEETIEGQKQIQTEQVKEEGRNFRPR